jgi:hypothetical protein
MFTLGQPDRQEGIEWIAESGRIDMLVEKTMAGSGVATGFSPLVYVVHESGMPLFSEGSADRGEGLEAIAESGMVSKLGDALAANLPEGASMSGMVTMPVGADKPGLIRPGDSFSFQIEAMPGDKLSLASMFGASNDWFVGFGPAGLALFDAAGKAMTGDVTSSLMLWDVGTEMSEELAVGPNTGPQQPDPPATGSQYRRAAARRLQARRDYWGVLEGALPNAMAVRERLLARTDWTLGAPYPCESWPGVGPRADQGQAASSVQDGRGDYPEPQLRAARRRARGAGDLPQPARGCGGALAGRP